MRTDITDRSSCNTDDSLQYKEKCMRKSIVSSDDTGQGEASGGSGYFCGDHVMLRIPKLNLYEHYDLGKNVKWDLSNVSWIEGKSHFGSGMVPMKNEFRRLKRHTGCSDPSKTTKEECEPTWKVVPVQRPLNYNRLTGKSSWDLENLYSYNAPDRHTHTHEHEHMDQWRMLKYHEEMVHERNITEKVY